MKKLNCLLICLSMFILIGFSNVNAKVYKVGLNFDVADSSSLDTPYLHILNKFINDSKFSDFLITKGNGLNKYLENYLPDISDLKSKYLSNGNVGIFSSDDTFLQQFTKTGTYYGEDSVSSAPTNSKYAFLFYFQSDHWYYQDQLNHRYYDEHSFDIRSSDNKEFQLWMDDSSLDGYILYFDENLEFIDYFDFKNNRQFGLSYTNDTFDRLMGLFYHTDQDFYLKNVGDSIVMDYIIHDGKKYVQNGSDKMFTINWFLHSAFRNWFGSVPSYEKFKDFDVSFYSNNPIIASGKPFNSIFDVLLDYSEVKIPKDYSQAFISSYNNGYYFSTLEGCSDDDYLIYGENDGKIKINYSFYKKNDNNLSYTDSYFIDLVNSVGAYQWNFWNLNLYDNPHEPRIDYFLHIKAYDSISDLVIYYNPKCYNAVPSRENHDLTIYDSSGSQIYLSKDKINSNNNSENNFIKDNYFYDENGNSTITDTPIDEKPSFDFGLSTLTEAIKSFANSVFALGSMLTSFMSSMPPFIVTAFSTIFYLGIVGILLKLLF